MNLPPPSARCGPCPRVFLLGAVSLLAITAAGASLQVSIRPGSEAGGLDVRSVHCPGDVFDFRTCEGVVVGSRDLGLFQVKLPPTFGGGQKTWRRDGDRFQARGTSDFASDPFGWAGDPLVALETRELQLARTAGGGPIQRSDCGFLRVVHNLLDSDPGPSMGQPCAQGPPSQPIPAEERPREHRPEEAEPIRAPDFPRGRGDEEA